MKPKNIFLIRHGESAANSNISALSNKADWKIELSDKGTNQASEAGKALIKTTGDVPVRIYCSPLVRTRLTAAEIMNHYSTVGYREDPRLREQDWGNYYYDNQKFDLVVRAKFGKFYYRFPDGESCADVYDRISLFLESLWRDFNDDDFPKNIIIVTHGMALRIFLMRWFHYEVEYFDRIANPKNCEIVNISLNEEANKYELTTMLRMHPNVQFEDFE